MDGIVKIIMYIGFFAFGALVLSLILKPEIVLGVKAQRLIEQCEVELPRNQDCILKAIPNE